MFFYLKEPNNDKETIIIIQYYIADEKKYLNIPQEK